MLKRFLIAFITTALVSGGYFYYLKSTGQETAAAQNANSLETAAGSEPSANVDFTLVDQNGKKFTEKDWQGKKLLVYFGFTNCPDTCPVSMAVMSEVLNQLPTANVNNLQAVFITIDPKHDKPAMLKKFLKDYNPSFIALTGDQAEIDKLAKSFKVYAETPKNPMDAEDSPNHSNLIYYMDANGKYISHFTSDNAPEDIVDYISSH